MTSTDDNAHPPLKPIHITHIKMDPLNQQALAIMITKGTTAAVKHMFTHETTGLPLTYSEMRERYG